MEALVLKDGTYEYDDRTRQVSVPEDELKKAGYVKLADDEQVVKKVELSEEEAQFMKNHKHLSFYEFSDSASIYVKSSVRETFGGCVVERRLNNAYFNGYVIKEPKYYIKLPEWVDKSRKQDNQRYLNINEYDEWELDTKYQIRSRRTKFTQSEIDTMQQDERAKGLDLNGLKIKVPDEELAD